MDEVKPQVLEMPVRLKKENLVDRISVVDVGDVGGLGGQLAALGNYASVGARLGPSGIDQSLKSSANGGSADMESLLQFLLGRKEAARREDRLADILSEEFRDVLVPVLSGWGLR